MSDHDLPHSESDGGDVQPPDAMAPVKTPDVFTPAAAPAMASPVVGGDRIDSIDVLRGFALLGVLLMNMQSFAMPLCAYMNPSSYGTDNPLNFVLWSIAHVVADAKFITIFSMLFGAGIVLMTSRAEARTGRSAGVHYRRMLWLGVFGALHGVLVWYGDILLTYALCGLIVWLFRRRRSWLLVLTAVILMGIPVFLLANFSTFIESQPPEEVEKMMEMWAPTAETIQAKETAYRGGYSDHLPVRFEAWVSMIGFLFIFGWRVLGVMLLGMALLKGGVFSAAKSKRFYTALIVIGFGSGMSLSAYGVYYQNGLDWEMRQCMGIGGLFNYFGSMLSAFGWIGVIMLLCRSEYLSGLKHRLGATGRMAFTNYIMQSVLCTTLFYGHGFGCFGRFDRLDQWGVVAVIAALQLWYSPLWLKHFRFGPLEWLWRSLTYWRRQPMRRQPVG